MTDQEIPDYGSLHPEGSRRGLLRIASKVMDETQGDNSKKLWAALQKIDELTSDYFLKNIKEEALIEKLKAITIHGFYRSMGPKEYEGGKKK